MGGRISRGCCRRNNSDEASRADPLTGTGTVTGSVIGTVTGTPKANRLPWFVPPVVGGNVIRVYDGDTITIASKVPGLVNSAVYQFSVRLAGIDTPELKTSNAEEKQLGIMARDALRAKILGKDVRLQNVATEKYGRLLADVYHDELHLNRWLINERYAVPYDGGKKQSPDSWMLYHVSG
jgi:micrococcal nuclease